MAAQLEILSPGMSASIQDQGRFGYGRFGVPRSGAVDPVLLRLGNALVGNEPFEPAIEFRFMGPSIKAVGGSVRVGLACYAGGELTEYATQKMQSISPWQTVTLGEGDVLKLLPFNKGVTGYLTIEGGCELTPVLGSSATYARARLGGINGSFLQSGDKLVMQHSVRERSNEKIMEDPVDISDDTLRIIPGPQDDHFAQSEFAAFLNGPYIVSSDGDRMGIRLEGRKLDVLPDKGYDLISDGLVPGAIQVPGSGQPIILSVDCQSVGGYPKIATIISADLHRLGQLCPGQKTSFKKVDILEAKEAHFEAEKAIDKAISSIKNYNGEPVVNTLALYESNLVGGVVDAQKLSNMVNSREDDS